MSSKRRGEALEDFKNKKNLKVMVAGLRCGGLGLNLNFANRVIITYALTTL